MLVLEAYQNNTVQLGMVGEFYIDTVKVSVEYHQVSNGFWCWMPQAVQISVEWTSFMYVCIQYLPSCTHVVSIWSCFHVGYISFTPFQSDAVYIMAYVQ